MTRAMAFLMGHRTGGCRYHIGVNVDDYLKGKSEAHREALERAARGEALMEGPWTLPDRLQAVQAYINRLCCGLPSWSLFNPGLVNSGLFSVSEKRVGESGAGGSRGVTADSLAIPGSGHIWACIDEYAKPGKRFAEDLALGILYVPVLSHHSTTKLLR